MKSQNWVVPTYVSYTPSFILSRGDKCHVVWHDFSVVEGEEYYNCTDQDLPYKDKIDGTADRGTEAHLTDQKRESSSSHVPPLYYDLYYVLCQASDVIVHATEARLLRKDVARQLATR
nr:hypothetical protein HmN_000924600 [Hymenolepis microstoma]